MNELLLKLDFLSADFADICKVDAEMFENNMEYDKEYAITLDYDNLNKLKALCQSSQNITYTQEISDRLYMVFNDAFENNVKVILQKNLYNPHVRIECGDSAEYAVFLILNLKEMVG